MNDVRDRQMQDGTYIMSFSIGEEENVATWIMYGRDAKGYSCKGEDGLCGMKMDQAVRLKFRMKALNKWVRDVNDGKHKVYIYDDKKEGLLRLQKNLEITARLLDVAYVGSNKNEKNKVYAPCIKLGKVEYKISDWPSCGHVKAKHVPFFKFKGWEYERETRLIVEIKGMKSFPDYIFLPFEPIETLIAEATSNTKDKDYCSPITMGPWFNENENYQEIKGLDVNKNTGRSFYLNQIDLNTRNKVGNV